MAQIQIHVVLCILLFIGVSAKRELKDQDSSNLEEVIAKLHYKIAEQDLTIAQVITKVAEQEVTISKQNGVIAEQNTKIAKLNYKITGTKLKDILRISEFTKDTEIDECQSYSCRNNGCCVDEVDSFKCICLEGYIGHTCEKEIDECQSNPCQNNGSCVDEVDSFKCICLEGYIGRTCEKETDECQSNPCRNNGSCVDEVDSFRCICPTGYIGRTCEKECTLTVTKGQYIHYHRSGSEIRNETGMKMKNEECSKLCSLDQNCTAWRYEPGICYLHKLPMISVTVKTSFDECKTLCLSNAKCHSFSSEYKRCALFDKPLDYLVLVKHKKFYTGVKLCKK